ncbi:MAG: hypothetical protein RL318_2568 [Fibrobacterota bacterium]|jgi:hypothetical protein
MVAAEISSGTSVEPLVMDWTSLRERRQVTVPCIAKIGWGHVFELGNGLSLQVPGRQDRSEMRPARVVKWENRSGTCQAPALEILVVDSLVPGLLDTATSGAVLAGDFRQARGKWVLGDHAFLWTGERNARTRVQLEMGTMYVPRSGWSNLNYLWSVPVDIVLSPIYVVGGLVVLLGLAASGGGGMH